MKLPKWVVERRVKLMEESGIEFRCGVDAAPIAAEIAAECNAIVLACGARTPRRVDVPGADLDGIHFAVEYLGEATRALLEGREPRITAAGKDVAVIGGGDTGVDCVATAMRQGARSVRQIIRAKRPPEAVDPFTVWPGTRNVYSQGYGQHEAAELCGDDPRLWATDTVGFADDGKGGVAAVQTVPIPPAGEGQEVPAQLVLIAKGFTGPEQSVLDAFAGSGALGIEALSRGASRAVFYELDPKAAKVLSRNVSACKLGQDRAAVIRRDVLKTPPTSAEGPFDLLFLDPPYALHAQKVVEFLERVKAGGGLSPDAIVVYEHALKSADEVASAFEDAGIEAIARKKYGKTGVTMVIIPT